MKLLALLLIVLVLYFLKKQISTLQWQKIVKSRTKALGSSAEELVMSLESVFLVFIFWTSLMMAIVLVIHLVHELFHIANVSRLWPANIPFIIIIPSVATIAVILQHMRDIILAITNAIILLVYLLFGLPLSMTIRPVSAGINYAQSSALLLLVVLITGPALYFVILFFPVCYLTKVYQLKFTLLEFILVAYLVYYVTSILISIMTEVLLRVLIRPLWRQQRMP